MYHKFDRLRMRSLVRSLSAQYVAPLRQLQLSLFAIGVLLVVGTGGFMLIEEMGFIDSLYMTVITLTTVGFGEIEPLSQVGRVFTIVLIFLGVTVAAWGLRNMFEVTIGDRLWHSLAIQTMETRSRTIENHYIICGYGRMGRAVVAEMVRRGQPFVVVDRDPVRSEMLLNSGIIYVNGDSTQDEVLLAAGIDRARGLVAVVNNDADNIMTVLSARGLNPRLVIVARSGSEEAEKKLRRAGANRVLSPYAVGGLRLALALLRPGVNDFLNTVIYSEQLHIEMGEVTLPAESVLIGETLASTNLRTQWNAIVVAIKDAHNQLTISPDPSRRLEAGDTLIIVAPSEALRELEMGRWAL